MVDQIIRPANLPRRSNPVASEIVPVDNSVEVAGSTIQEMVEAGRPTANQSESEAGVNSSKNMAPLNVKQAIDFQVPAKINSAIGALNLGTAAQRNADEFATAAQGAKADTAVQKAALSPFPMVFPTYAEASTATLQNLQIVEVSVDETRASARTRYRVEGGSLVFSGVVTRPIADKATAEAGLSNDYDMGPLGTRYQIEAGGRLQGRGRGLVADTNGDMQPVLQAIIDIIISQATTLNDTIGAPIIEIPAGKYKFLSGITIPPWIKLKAVGNVSLDFSGAGPSVVAIRSSNAAAPSGTTGRNAGNRGAMLNGDDGTIYIVGPGLNTSSVCLDFGNEAAGPDAKDFRDMFVSNVVVDEFDVALKVRNFDTYLMSFSRVRFERNNTSIKISGGTVVNSGERMLFENSVFAGSAVGKMLEHDSDSVDITFISCSTDFQRKMAVLATPNSRYAKLSFLEHHFEGCSEDGLIVRQGTDTNRLVVSIANSKIVPTTNGSKGWPDGRSAAYTELFKGPMILDVNGFVVGGYQMPWHNAEQGLFMCDKDVAIIGMRGIEFNERRQLPSRRLISNRNSNFNDAVLASDPNQTALPGWVVTNSGNLGAVVDDALAFAPSSKALKLTATGTGNFYVIESDPFAVDRVSRVMAQSIAYGGASTGNMRIENRVKYYRREPLPAIAIASISKSGGTVTVTTERPHRLSAGRFVELSGLNEADYNRRVRVNGTPSATTFTFRIATGYAAPTGSPTYIVDPIAFVSQGNAVGDNFAALYADTDFPGFTGTRDWWCRNANIPYSINQVPAGAEFATIETTVSGLNSGDVIWLGEAVASVLK